MGNNYLLASDFRKKARTSLKGKWGKGVPSFIIVYLLSILVYVLYYIMIYDQLFFIELGLADWGDLIVVMGASLVVGIILLVIGCGMIFYTKKITKGEEISFLDLFESFPRFKDVFLLILLEGIFICLWLLLFVIPGIVAFYRYRLAIYILFDNPSKSPMDCIRESKRIMDGRKGRLFCLDLSFLGWYMLLLLPTLVLAKDNSLTALIVFFVIGMPAYTLYVFTASAEFYKEVIENELPQESVTADSSELYIDDTKNDNNEISETTDHNESSYYRDPSEVSHAPKDEDKKDQESPKL